MSETLWRQQSEDRAIVGWADRNRTAACGVVIAGLVAAWLASYGVGGSRTVLPHLFYLPILVAAARFGHRGALVVAAMAGVAAGPLLPVDVATGEAQSVPNWMGRLAAFVVVGQVTAALHSRSLAVARDRLHDRSDRIALQEALERGEFVPVFQPIVDLSDGQIRTIEALARWVRSDGTVVGPDEFIGAAERTGLIGPIGLSILEQSCTQLAAWTTRDGHRPWGLSMSVNLSPCQLDAPALVAQIASVLDRTGVDPATLILEVTETGLAADPDAATRQLDELRALGVRIALDDFGVGHSSLAILHRFPIDIVKIDRTFTSTLGTDPRVGAMIEAVVGLTQALGIVPPVAEGIETPEQLRAVTALGCGAAQGYLLARPQPATEVEQLLIEGTTPFRVADLQRPVRTT